MKTRATSSILVIALFLAGCGGDSPDATEPNSGSGNGDQASMTATSEEMSAGRAEDADASSKLASDDVAFLERLGLIRGHLHAGHALYINDLADMAVTHMKHPRDELYAGLVPAIEARGLDPFDVELTGLKDAVESGAPREDVTAAWRAVDGAIETIERGTSASPRDELLAIAGMLDTAAEEYAIGVVEGVIDNVHEYQDAWGFTQVALERVGQVAVTSDVERTATAEAGVAVSGLADHWPNLDPQVRLETNASTITAAADRVRGVAEDLN